MVYPANYFSSAPKEAAIGILSYEAEASSLLESLVKVGYTGTVFGGDSWSRSTAQIAGMKSQLKELCIINALSYDVSDSSPANKRFVKDFRVQYRREPTDVAALAFDTATAISIASGKCMNKPSVVMRSCLLTELRLVDFFGASGRVRFDAIGSRSGGAQLQVSLPCKG